MNSTSQENKKPNKALKIVLNVVLWIFLAFAFVTMVFSFIAASNEYSVPMIGNKVILNVKSDSMKPTFKTGDMLIATKLTNEEKMNLQVGDIITYFVDLDGDGTKELNTHRISTVNGDGTYKTKGDNHETNPTEDNYVLYQNEIIAIWHEGDTKIGGLGGLIGFIQSTAGFVILIVIPLSAFFIYELVRFIMIMVSLKNGGKKKYSAEEEAIRQKLYEEYLLKQQSAAAEKTESAENADGTTAADGATVADTTENKKE